MSPGQTPGAFGKGGGGWRPYSSRPASSSGGGSGYSSSRPTHRLDDVVQVSDLETAQSGRGLTVYTHGNRYFIPAEPGKGVTEGWSGKVKITRGPFGNGGNLYEAIAVIDAPKPIAQPATKPVAPAAAPAYTAPTAKPAATTPAASAPTPAQYFLQIGDFGASKPSDYAICPVGVKYQGMKAHDGIAALIRDGVATTDQGRSVLQRLKQHLDAGPIMEIGGVTPDAKMTLLEYLKMDDASQKAGVPVKVKGKPVQPPADVEVMKEKEERGSSPPPAPYVPTKSARVGGHRSGGATLENLL